MAPGKHTDPLYIGYENDGDAPERLSAAAGASPADVNALYMKAAAIRQRRGFGWLDGGWERVAAVQPEQVLPRKGSVWRNRKHGTLYVVTGRRFDATGATEGRIMVSYDPVPGRDRSHLAEVDCDDYARELGEFLVKFEPVPEAA